MFLSVQLLAGSLEVLCLFPGLGAPWDSPPEELDNMGMEKEVWASLLLPIQPDPR